MPNEPQEQEPTQRTPEGAERERFGLPGDGGTEIPIPAREQVLDDFAKVAKAKPSQGPRRPKE